MHLETKYDYDKVRRTAMITYDKIQQHSCKLLIPVGAGHVFSTSNRIVSVAAERDFWIQRSNAFSLKNY